MLLNIRRHIVVGLLTAWHAASASVWSPTASDVNFFAFSSFGGWTQTGTIGIFEDTDNIATSKPVAQFSGGATVSFAKNGSDWNITVESKGVQSSPPIKLSGSDQFQLGWLSSGIWIPQSGNNSNPWTPNFWQLTFIDNSFPFNNTETLYATNIKLYTPIVATAAIATPLPAAAWSFIAGMMGLLALSKRRQR